MMRYVLAASILLCAVACTTTRSSLPSQEAQVAKLRTLETRVVEGAAGLRTEQLLGKLDTITGVPVQDAVRWVLQSENDVRRLVASEEWEGLAVADFVRGELDLKVHESSMVAELGLVPLETIQQYVRTFRDILRRAQTDEAFRVTFEVQTIPRGATFHLCREYAPTDCTRVGTNVRFDRIYRGRYIYTITMGGYHPVEVIPLNLVHFTQSVLKCPLRKVTDSAGAVPCTPQ